MRRWKEASQAIMACAAPQQSEGPGTAGLRGSTTPPDRCVGRLVAAHSAVPFAFLLPLTVIVTGGSGVAVVAFLRLLGGGRVCPLSGEVSKKADVTRKF